MKTKTNLKFAVWIGGIANYFNTLKEAKEEKKRWIRKGYNDLIIQKIKQ